MFVLLASLLLLQTGLGLCEVHTYAFKETLKRSTGQPVNWEDYGFSCALIFLDSNTTIDGLCTCSVLSSMRVLTSGTCITDRPNMQNITIKLLMHDNNGPISLRSQKFKQYDIMNRQFHPLLTEKSTYIFSTNLLNGTIVNFNATLNPHDLAIVSLKTPIENAVATTFANQLPQVGSPVILLGYGGPNYFELRATSYTKLLPSQKVTPTGQLVANDDIIFFHDTRTGIQANSLEDLENGDEGGLILNTQKQQIGVGAGAWYNLKTGEKLASFGPSILESENVKFINNVLSSPEPLTSVQSVSQNNQTTSPSPSPAPSTTSKPSTAPAPAQPSHPTPSHAPMSKAPQPEAHAPAGRQPSKAPLTGTSSSLQSSVFIAFVVMVCALLIFK